MVNLMTDAMDQMDHTSQHGAQPQGMSRAST
jgi:hypothetical protein